MVDRDAATHRRPGPPRRGPVIGVDEHKWPHARSAQAEGFVTVITGLTAVVVGAGPAPAARPGPRCSSGGVDELARRTWVALPRRLRR